MTLIDHKDIKLSEKVKEILFRKGYSHIFNWNDYEEFKHSTQDAIFQAEAIANLFIEWNSHEVSDFAEYEF